MKGIVVAALSGGVDSAVAASLLKDEGYQVIGVSMRLWTEDDGHFASSHRRCCAVEDVDDARRVCQILGIPFYYLNLERDFRRHVVDDFRRQYSRGRTPNPCLECNRWLKFDLLLRRALALGADFLATGHYARVQRSNAFWHLLKARDPARDQSYLLYMLGQWELSHILFPLGDLHKDRVRSLARERGLPVWDKPDSQEICFVRNGDYRSFLREQTASAPGDICDREGRLLGVHQGLAGFTVGQHRGLGLQSDRKLYVLALDPESNRVVVGPEQELYRHTLQAAPVSFVSGEGPAVPLAVAAKVRYRSPQAPARLVAGGGSAELSFERPQRAIAPGQAVVFYQGEEVLGGGIIAG